MNFAILGPGKVARYHRQGIEAAADLGARLVAVAHPNPARSPALSAEFGVPCRTYEDVLADPQIDAVCICTPSGRHAGQAVSAARAGKHVFVEKPMALTLADADRMIDACTSAGVCLGVAYQRRAEPLFRDVHGAIADGGLGELTMGMVSMPYYRDAAYYASAAWRGTWALDGGGVLMNQGIHLIDLLVWYMGDPVEVQGFAGTLHREIEVEDTLAAALRFGNGALATVVATTTAAPGFAHGLAVYGTRGGLYVEGEQIHLWRGADPSAKVAPPSAGGADAGAGGDPMAIAPTGHVRLIRDFIDAAKTGSPPLVDGPEGRRSLATVLAIYEACRVKAT